MGVMQPSPVMTTRFTSRDGSLLLRRCGGGSGALGGLLRNQPLDAANNVTYRTEGAECVIRDSDVKGFLDFERDVDLIERIDVELLEAGLRGDGVGGDAFGLGDDSDTLRGDLVHGVPFLFRMLNVTSCLNQCKGSPVNSLTSWS